MTQTPTRLAERQFHHVTLEMPQGGEAHARHFYRSVLGLTEIAIPAPLREHEGGSVWFAIGAQHQVHLGPVEDFHPQRRAHVALQITDLEDLRSLCQQAGVRVQAAKAESGWLRCYAFDPFGNKLEFRQRQQG